MELPVILRIARRHSSTYIPIAYLQTFIRSPRGFVALSRPATRTFLIRLAVRRAFRLHFSIFRAIFAFFRAIWVARPRFWSAGTLPGQVFGGQNDGFSRFFVARARSELTSSEVYTTLAGVVSSAHRYLRAMKPKRRKCGLRAFKSRQNAVNALEQRS